VDQPVWFAFEQAWLRGPGLVRAEEGGNSVDSETIIAIVLSALAALALFKTPRAERIGDPEARAAARGRRVFGSVVMIVMLLFGYGTCVAAMHMNPAVYFSAVAIMVLLVAGWNNFA
jgi:hypothetical protein